MNVVKISGISYVFLSKKIDVHNLRPRFMSQGLSQIEKKVSGLEPQYTCTVLECNPVFG